MNDIFKYHWEVKHRLEQTPFLQILANDVTTHADLDRLLRTSIALRHAKTTGTPTEDAQAIPVQPPVVPVMCITTTLSAGEFNPAGGATDDTTHHKQLYWPPNNRGPQVLIIDPSLTKTTPERVWLSTGLRAMDHCVETICSSNPKPEGTEASLRGIKALIPGLLRSKDDPDDLEARLSCQLGAAESMRASVVHGVRVG